MTDNSDYRLYLESKFEGLTKHINAQFINVNDRLEAIELQTTKTNGRVTALEDDFIEIEKTLLTHPVNCDKAKVIDEIKEEVSGLHDAKISAEAITKIKDVNWLRIIQVIGTIIAFGMLLIGYRNLERISRATDNKVDNLGVPFATNKRGEPLFFNDTAKIYYWPTDSEYVYIIKKLPR